MSKIAKEKKAKVDLARKKKLESQKALLIIGILTTSTILVFLSLFYLQQSQDWRKDAAFTPGALR